MTYEEYELGYYTGDSEDSSEPPEDPETHAMLEHLVEFETETVSYTHLTLPTNREV